MAALVALIIPMAPGTATAAIPTKSPQCDFPTPTPPPLIMGGTFQAGSTVINNGCYEADGSFSGTQLSFTSNGDLVVTKDGKMTWDSGTGGKAANGTMTLTSDGNLSVSDSDNTVVWTTDTHIGVIAFNGGYLGLDSSGDLTLSTAGTKQVTLWTSTADSFACTNGRLAPQSTIRYGVPATDTTLLGTIHCQNNYAAILTTGGTLKVLDATTNTVLFSSPERAGFGGWVTFQLDGNTVLYGSDGKPAWASNTRKGAFTNTWLDMQSDGNFVSYGVSNGVDVPLWDSGIPAGIK